MDKKPNITGPCAYCDSPACAEARGELVCTVHISPAPAVEPEQTGAYVEDNRPPWAAPGEDFEPERPTCCPGHADPYASGRCEPHKTTTYPDPQHQHPPGFHAGCLRCVYERGQTDERARIERIIEGMPVWHSSGGPKVDRTKLLAAIRGGDDD